MSGKGNVGAALSGSQKVDMISFTGSVKTGEKYDDIPLSSVPFGNVQKFVSFQQCLEQAIKALNTDSLWLHWFQWGR